MSVRSGEFGVSLYELGNHMLAVGAGGGHLVGRIGKFFRSVRKVVHHLAYLVNPFFGPFYHLYELGNYLFRYYLFCDLLIDVQ